MPGSGQASLESWGGEAKFVVVLETASVNASEVGKSMLTLMSLSSSGWVKRGVLFVQQARSANSASVLEKLLYPFARSGLRKSLASWSLGMYPSLTGQRSVFLIGKGMELVSTTCRKNMRAACAGAALHAVFKLIVCKFPPKTYRLSVKYPAIGQQ